MIKANILLPNGNIIDIKSHYIHGIHNIYIIMHEFAAVLGKHAAQTSCIYEKETDSHLVALKHYYTGIAYANISRIMLVNPTAPFGFEMERVNYSGGSDIFANYEDEYDNSDFHYEVSMNVHN